ncbi:MAG: hypothetical protein CL859_10560 [Cyanobium sp. ARS6]|nr:hypothetical protein [Cyanobium sp. ARS6]
MPPKRRRRPTAPRAAAETEILEKGRWHQLRDNERLHSPEENQAAQRRCRQLIEGGADAVDWLELYGQK